MMNAIYSINLEFQICQTLYPLKMNITILVTPKGKFNFQPQGKEIKLFQV